MSKKKQQKRKSGRPASAEPRKGTSAASNVKKAIFPLMTEAPVTDRDAWYRKIFLGLAGFVLLVMVAGGLASGINADDEYQHDYSEKLVQYYATLGRDTSAYYIENGDMHYYGGFFDLVTGAVNESLGLQPTDAAYNDIRHIFNAIFGFLTALFVGLTARNIAGWRAGIAALVLLALSPRFLGHSFMNPKDVPFAAGFAIAFYYLLRLLRQLPSPTWKTFTGLALGIALALATRAGGLLLLGYLGMFMGLHFLANYGWRGIVSEYKTTGRYLLYGLGAIAAGYTLAVLTWPAALRDPLRFPFEALSAFSVLGVKIRVLFMGENLMSDDTAWYYALVWIFRTVPLYVHLGLLLALVFLRGMLKTYGWLPVFMLFFATFFPLGYIIVKNSVLHDGWRHLMFVYPSMVVLITLGWYFFEQKYAGRKQLAYALYGVLALTALEPASFIVRNFQYPYVYFNPIGGGMKGAFGNFETDYWGISVKEAIHWLEKENILSENMPDTIRLGTHYFYNVRRQLSDKYKVKVVYVRYNRRYTEDWDYGIFPSRYIRGAHLRAGTWPNSKTVHVVKANGVPLLAIEKDLTDDALRGEQALQAARWEESIEAFTREVNNHPDNETAWLGLANANINVRNFAASIDAANRALEVAPESENAYFYRGLAQLQQNQLEPAVRDLEAAIAVNDEFYVAHYYLAAVMQTQGNLPKALDYILTAIQINPSFKPAYELAASIYEQQGDTRNAQLYRAAAQRLQ